MSVNYDSLTPVDEPAVSSPRASETARTPSAQIWPVVLEAEEPARLARAERRLELLHRLNAQSPYARTPLEACRTAARALAALDELEFVLVYLTDDDRRCAVCAAASGRTADPTPRQPVVELDAAEPLAALFRELVTRPSARELTGSQTVISAFPSRSTGRGRALVAPIAPAPAATIAGFLVLGPVAEVASDDGDRRFAEMVGTEIGRGVDAARSHGRPGAIASRDGVRTARVSDSSPTVGERELKDVLGDLRAAQRRAVTAGDVERQRIERNLHDGAQQRLMAIRLELGVLAETLEQDPDGSRAELQRLRGQLDEALEELREIAHGLYPPLLSSDGLRAAISAAARGATIPVGVEFGEFPRLPRAIENAAYFCCTEALQNVAKHAGDRARAMVSVRVCAGVLELRVVDDGAGFDPGAVPRGHGLTNLGDRLQALGGRAEIGSVPGQGTTVVGWIPLTGPADPPLR